MESEGPRVHKSPLLDYVHLGMLQDSPHLEILFIKINRQASHPPKCSWDSNLTSRFHVFRLSFYVHPSHPSVHAARNAFSTPLV